MVENIIRAARLGGAKILEYFGQTHQIFNKTSLADFRTEADLASEKAILDELQQNFADFNFYSEEKGWIKRNSDYTFMIDPLDGTNNFSINLPNLSVSIGLLHHRQIIAGVIYQPIIEELYSAEFRQGAYLNGIRLHTNQITAIDQSTIAYTCGYAADGTVQSDLIRLLYHSKVKRFMNNWSPALDYCRVASGRIEAVICDGNEIIDNIAGKLILKESGGEIIRFDGKPETDETDICFIAANNSRLGHQLQVVCSQINGLANPEKK